MLKNTKCLKKFTAKNLSLKNKNFRLLMNNKC